MDFRSHRSRAFAALIALGFVGVVSSSVFAQDATPTPDSAAVEVQLLTDKTSYKLGDPIDIRVLLTNRTYEPIYIRKPLDWGISASVEIWARDAVSGAPLSPKFLADSIDPPPRSKDNFVRLDPGDIYGVLFQNSRKALGIEKPGKYEIWAIYHSHAYESGFRFGLPSWKGEDRALRTPPVFVSVTP